VGVVAGASRRLSRSQPSHQPCPFDAITRCLDSWRCLGPAHLVWFVAHVRCHLALRYVWRCGRVWWLSAAGLYRRLRWRQTIPELYQAC
jgi:hypothetical protein